MRIPRIYTPQPLHSNQTITLEEAASRHIAKVLRMEAGRELTLFNGQGGEYTATLNDVGKKSVTATLNAHNPVNRESPLSTELAIGISRGERMDWVIQKATELGVSQITPLFTQRTEVKLTGDRLQKKINHWQQIAISACEQCQRNIIPTIEPAMTLTQWLLRTTPALKLVLHHRSSQRLEEIQQPEAIALLIGPEGGLSEEEINQAIAAKSQALTLGPRVFRTETAPIAALTLCQYFWGDLNEI